jgi:hypothetical protein
MTIVEPTNSGVDKELFRYQLQGCGITSIVLPTDIKCLEHVEFKCVRKIVRTVYKQPSLKLKGKVLTVKREDNISE